MSGRYRRIVDLVELTAMLQSTTNGVGIDQISDHFGVSRRTAERMLEALRERFSDLESRTQSGRKFWSLPTSGDTPPIHLPKRLESLSRRVAELEEELHRHAIADSALSESDVGIFVLDADFRVVWVNRALETYFGLSREKVVGCDKRTLIREHISRIFEDAEEFMTRVFATSDDNISIEHFLCHVLPGADREERWLEHWSQPIASGPYEGGRIEHYVDVTIRDSVAPEGVLGPRRARRVSHRAGGSSSTGNLADSVASRLGSLMEVAKKGIAAEVDAPAAWREVMAITEQMYEMLDVPRRTPHRGEVELEPCRAIDILNDVAEGLRRSSAERGIEIRIDAAECDGVFLADRTALVSAIVDLARAIAAEVETGARIDLRAARIDTLGCLSLSLSCEAAQGGEDESVQLRRRSDFMLNEQVEASVAELRRIANEHGGDLLIVRRPDSAAPAIAIQLPLTIAR